MAGVAPERAFLALIRGERAGPVAALLRAGLWLLALVYGLGVRLHHALFDLGLRAPARAGAPVVSVGNVTTGGTGKTPLIVLLARALLARGERPAVLARGYGAARDGEPNDELLVVRREAPGARLHPGRDRVARAAEAVRGGASALLLDDGFQHRRLHRDRDVVLVDATDPWGPAGLLPRGLLREPRRGLRRADVVLLTRAELVDAAALARVEAEARAAGFAGPVGRMTTAPVGLAALPGGPDEPLEALRGEQVLAACGIGNPAAFARGLEALGARVVGVEALPDHHAWTADDVQRVDARARALGAARVVVTVKDAVKLERLVGPGTLPWSALRIEARIDPPGLLDAILSLPGAPRV